MYSEQLVIQVATALVRKQFGIFNFIHMTGVDPGGGGRGLALS